MKRSERIAQLQRCIDLKANYALLHRLIPIQNKWLADKLQAAAVDDPDLYLFYDSIPAETWFISRAHMLELLWDRASRIVRTRPVHTSGNRRWDLALRLNLSVKDVLVLLDCPWTEMADMIVEGYGLRNCLRAVSNMPHAA